MKKQPWPTDIWMIPSRSNYDRALAEVWARDPDAVYCTDVATRLPVVIANKFGIERTAIFLPGFTWGKSPEETGTALIDALRL